MKTAGGIIAIIAGVLGTLAAIFTLLAGGLGNAVHAEGAATVVWMGWGGVCFSFLTIIFGAIAIGARTRNAGVLLILCSIAGAALGGTFVAVCMVLALVGGILAVIPGSDEHHESTPDSEAASIAATDVPAEMAPDPTVSGSELLSASTIAVMTLPLWGSALEYVVRYSVTGSISGDVTGGNDFLTFTAAFTFLNVMFCRRDERFLKNYYRIEMGREFILAMILVPVYLYVRGSKLRLATGANGVKTHAPFIAWWACIIASGIMGQVAGTFAESSLPSKAETTLRNRHPTANSATLDSSEISPQSSALSSAEPPKARETPTTINQTLSMPESQLEYEEHLEQRKVLQDDVDRLINDGKGDTREVGEKQDAIKQFDSAHPTPGKIFGWQCIAISQTECHTDHMSFGFQIAETDKVYRGDVLSISGYVLGDASSGMVKLSYPGSVDLVEKAK